MAEEEVKTAVGDEVEEKDPPKTPMKAPKTPMKASPKAPAKKPKAKASPTKAKAKAKTKVMNDKVVKKRPAAKEKSDKSNKSEPEVEEPPMKRPAASAKASMKRPAAKSTASGSKDVQGPDWASGIQLGEKTDAGDEEEPQELDEEETKTQDAVVETEELDVFETDQTKKDRSKDFKFKQLLSQGTLPAWIVKAWNETLKLKTGRVAKQREIVNQVLDRTSSGTLVVNLDNPVLSHIKDLCAFHHKRLCLHSFLDQFYLSHLS